MPASSLAIFLVVLLCQGYGLAAAKLPTAFPRCQVSPTLDKKDNECLRNAVEKAIHHLSIDGSKELNSLDLDPMKINRIYIERGENRPIAIKLDFTDNTLVGLTDLKINKIKGKISSPNNFHMVVEASVDFLSMFGPYKIQGKVLVLPIQGVGNSNMTMIKLKSIVHIKGSPVMKNGQEYLKIDDFQINMKPSRMYMNFENLFNGDRALGDNMNKFLNDNWRDIYGELGQPIEQAFDGIFKEYTRRLFSKVPFRDIFITQ